MADSKVRFDITANSDAAQRALAQLRREFDKTLADLKKQQGDIALFKAAQRDAAALERQIKSLSKAGGDTGALTNSLNAQRAAIAQQAAALQKAGIDTNALAAAQSRLKTQVDQTTRTFRGQSAAIGAAAANRQAAAAAAELANATRASGIAAQQSQAQFARYAAALLSVGAAVKGIGAITTAGMKIEALESTLLFATGSAEKAADAYAFVREEAMRLGLPLEVLGKQFAQISAASQGTTLQGDGVRKVFTSIASAARVMGLQTFQVERALLAVQQMMSKGSVQTEELRGQLGEQIPGAFNIAARAMNVTTGELATMLKAGEVVAEDFLPKFAEELQRTVDPAVPRAMKTYAAEVERLKNTFTIFLQEVGKSGALEAISEQVVVVTQKLREMSDSGELKPAIDDLVEALSLLATGLAEVAEFAAKNAQTILALGAAYAVFKAATIGIGLGKFVLELQGIGASAGVAAAGLTKAAIAARLLRRALLIGFAIEGVENIVQLVSLIREQNAAEEELARDRGRRNADADIAVIQNADYAKAVVKASEQVKAASDTEQIAYAKSLKAALAYWEAKVQIESRGTGINDPVSQAALDAARQARIYRTALAEFDKVSDARIKLEEKQAAAIRKIKESETATIELAVEAQIDAVKKARDALKDSEKDLAAIAKRTLEFQRQLAGAGQKDGPQSLLDISSMVVKARQLLASGDSDGALAQIEDTRAGMLDLVESGKEIPFFLQSYARELGVLAQQAGEARRAAAEEGVQDAERKLLTLQSLASEIERLAIDADVSAAEAEMQDLHRRTQAFYDANPLIVKVVTQRQDDIALGIEKAPKKASGGLLRGPGTGTSDSMLARVSNGEYVVRAAAVRRLGVARLNAINRGSLPQFADGGLIASAVGSLPRASGSAGGGATSVLNLTLPGVGSFETRASAAVAAELERALRIAALKNGRRT